MAVRVGSGTDAGAAHGGARHARLAGWPWVRRHRALRHSALASAITNAFATASAGPFVFAFASGSLNLFAKTRRLEIPNPQASAQQSACGVETAAGAAITVAQLSAARPRRGRAEEDARKPKTEREPGASGSRGR